MSCLKLDTKVLWVNSTEVVTSYPYISERKENNNGEGQKKKLDIHSGYVYLSLSHTHTTYSMIMILMPFKFPVYYSVIYLKTE